MKYQTCSSRVTGGVVMSRNGLTLKSDLEVM